MRKSADQLLNELVRHVRPPRGCAISLTEHQSSGPADPNWVAGSGIMNADCIKLYQQIVAELRKTNPQVDWSEVKMKTGTARVALWSSEVDGELP